MGGVGCGWWNGEWCVGGDGVGELFEIEIEGIGGVCCWVFLDCLERIWLGMRYMGCWVLMFCLDFVEFDLLLVVFLWGF